MEIGSHEGSEQQLPSELSYRTQTDFAHQARYGKGGDRLNDADAIPILPIASAAEDQVEGSADGKWGRSGSSMNQTDESIKMPAQNTANSSLITGELEYFP